MQSEIPDPFQFMIKHRKTIIKSLRQSSTLKLAWISLAEQLPEIENIIKFNTFKGYARILNVVNNKFEQYEKQYNKLSDELGKVRQIEKCLEKDLHEVRQKNDYLKKELGKVRQILNKNSEIENVNTYPACPDKNTSAVHHDELPNQIPNHKKEMSPKRFDGWGVQLRGQYYRLFKKIKGKVKWIHIGKDWDFEIARKKVEQFHKKMKSI